MTGSPQTQRQKRLDQERASRLDQLTYQMDEFYRNQKRLPADYEELRRQSTWWTETIGIDPETNSSFEYSMITEKDYQLCATFGLSSTETDSYRYPVSTNNEIPFWQHEAGHVCFKRTVRIQPEIPPIPVKN